MAGINNLKGAKITDYKILYKEEVGKGLWLIIFQQYLEEYNRPYTAHSTQFDVQVIVTETPSFQTSNNGILCVNELIQEKLLESETFNSLKKATSKDGFEIYQWSSEVRQWEEKGVKYKARELRWIGKIPLEFIVKLLKS